MSVSRVTPKLSAPAFTSGGISPPCYAARKGESSQRVGDCIAVIHPKVLHVAGMRRERLLQIGFRVIVLKALSLLNLEESTDAA